MRWVAGASGKIGLSPEYLTVDPRTLHLPPSRATGADPLKRARQIAAYGSLTRGMPEPGFIYRAADGHLMIYAGVTRATRVAKLLPGVRVRVEVVALAKGPTNEAIWDAEDADLLAAARKHLSDLRSRETSVA